jgi:hypothetical protein
MLAIKNYLVSTVADGHANSTTMLATCGLILASLLAASPLSAQAADLKMAHITPATLPFGMQSKKFIEDLSKKSGVGMTLMYMPAKKAEADFRSGDLDGETNRVIGFQKIFPDSIKVTPSAQSITLYTVTLTDDIKPGTWEDLAKFTVSYPRGYMAVETKIIDGTKKNPADSPEACLKQLIAKTVEVCLVGAWGIGKTVYPTLGTDMLDKEPYKSQLKIHKFNTQEIYFWLQPKYKAEAEKLGKALAEMVKSGDINRY